MKKKIVGFWENNGLLKLIFLFLALTVLILAILVVQKNSEEKSIISPDLVIPILGEDKEFAFNISALALSHENDYILKITNYKNDTINPEDVLYQITVMNMTNAEIEVHQLGDDRNLIEGENSVIEGERLVAGERGEVYYFFKMNKTSALDEKEVIQVKVESIGS